MFDTRAPRPFGAMLTAMITPFTSDGGIDLDGAARLATHLVDHGHDGLVINGTTGESPTTSDLEKDLVLRVVIDAVGDRATVVAGVGTNDTRHTVELAVAAEKAGAHGLLVVTPYYSKPPQTGLQVHFGSVADATGLPVMVYDIPARSGVPIEVETMVRLAEHPRIVAIKDAKGDLSATSWVMRRTDLDVYSGDDILNLPLLAIGAVGFVSVAGHLVGERLQSMIQAYAAGDVVGARDIHASLLPVYSGLFRTQAAILVKCALRELGLPSGPVRAPLVDATVEQLEVLRRDLVDAEVPGFAA